MSIGIRPTVDFAFKLMLGSPDHTSVTMHFLNAVLDGQRTITDVTILNPMIPQESDDDKLAILDILARDELGRLMNIEMQTSIPDGLPQRLLYYSTCLYSEQLSKGVNYSELCPVISICVLTRVMFPLLPGMHLDFRLREATGTELTDNLQIHLLELPKLRLTAENVYQASPVDQWAYFLTNADKLSLADVTRMFPDPVFSEAAGVLNMISRTPEQQMFYDARLKALRDHEMHLSTARRQGLEEGCERGLLIGRIQLVQELLGQRISRMDDMKDLSISELQDIEKKLRTEMRSS